MKQPHFSRKEFDTLFAGRFESDEERREAYQSFQLLIEQLDRAEPPTLSAYEKAEIFRRAWPQPASARPSLWTWLAFLRRPAVAFALGIVVGCLLMVARPHEQLATAPAQAAEPPLTVERAGRTEVYRGELIQKLYPKIENPKMIVEKTPEGAPPQRILQGTLDNGEIYVVWNL